MRSIPQQGDIQERKLIWQGIDWWRIKRGLTPQELARRAEFPLESLRKGLQGEPEPIRDKLINFADALSISSGREGKHYEDTIETLSYHELVEIITAPLRRPSQISLWDDQGGR